MTIASVPDLVRRLYGIVGELEAAFPGRHFTPDGHLLGSLGEVLAAHHYGLELLPASRATHDATSRDSRPVQIKATQGNRVSMRADCDLLLVLKLDRHGGFEEIFNGPGTTVWAAAGPMQRNGQRTISVSKLRKLNAAGSGKDRIARVEWRRV